MPGRHWHLLPLLLALTGPALAVGDSAVRVERLACAEGLQLTSRGAPLSQVLQQMSQTLGFELKYWSHDDPPIHWDARRQPIELMTALSQQANLLVRYVPDRRCAGRSRISSVHVLPVGQAAAPTRPAAAAPRTAAPGAASATLPAAARAVPRAAAPARPAPPAAVNAAPFEYDESQDEYMRAHGIEPPARPSAGARR
jgi:hypothetical protein